MAWRSRAELGRISAEDAPAVAEATRPARDLHPHRAGIDTEAEPTSVVERNRRSGFRACPLFTTAPRWMPSWIARNALR